jgi:hypothetical protein
VLARFFAHRPVFAWVISIAIMLAGIASIAVLPIAQYPDVAPPTIQVTATYPGANAMIVGDTVATPIEQEVNGVERMLYMSSKCTNDGQMNLDVTFELGTNLDTAQVLVQNPNGRLVPGSSVRVRIPVSDSQAVTTVPDVAILSDQDRKYLLVVDPKNVVQRRDVRLGKLLDDGMRVILPAGGNTQPLGGNDWLIVDGLQTARVNYAADPVRPATQPAKMVSAQGQPLSRNDAGGDR